MLSSKDSHRKPRTSAVHRALLSGVDRAPMAYPSSHRLTEIKTNHARPGIEYHPQVSNERRELL